MIRVFSLLVLMVTPVAAAAPRPITVADALEPICFGFAPADQAIYAVRTKSTCDAANKCEVASYLTRVTTYGVGKTVGYLALARKEGAMPSAADALKSVNPSSLAKANEALADATVPCATAKVGDTLRLDNGRTVKVLPASQGIILRSDNFRDIELPIPFEHLFWGPSVQTWFLRRSAPTEGGQDTMFIALEVSTLFGPPPRPASPQAIALTTANALSPQCVGAHNASGRYWFNTPTVASDHVRFQIVEVGPSGVHTFDIARKPRVAMAPDPKLAAAALTAKELAFANALLADIDAPCSVVVPPLLDAPPLTLSAKIDGAAVELSTVTGKKGKQLRFRGPLGARRHVSAEQLTIVHSANGSKTVIVQSIGASSSFEAVDLSSLPAEPRRFEVPRTFPACVSLGQLHVVAFEQTPERAALVLRRVEQSDPPRLVLAEGPADATIESLLAQLTPERLIDLAEELPAAKASDCRIVPIGPSGDVELHKLDGPWRLDNTIEGDSWIAKVVDVDGAPELRVGDLRVHLEGRPQWVLRANSVTKLITVDGGRFTLHAVGAWEWLPQPVEEAMKAPKRLARSTPAPTPADRRCLAWNSNDRSAWIVRWQQTCNGYECDSMAVLTEVRSDGYYQRVTLAKDGSDWDHMFGHANALVQKADLGCIAGFELGSVGRLVKVSSDPTHVIVEVDRKAKKVTKLGDSERLVATFSHPQVGAIAIEISGNEGTRYLWVDISKFK